MRFKSLYLINIIIFNIIAINTFSQNSANEIFAIINTDVDSIIITENNLKTVSFSLSGIYNDQKAEEVNSLFSIYGGVISSNIIKSETPGVYDVYIKFFEKAHLNYFLKMLITFNINNVLYKGTMEPVDALKKNGFSKNTK